MVERIRDQAALLQQGTVGIFASRPSDAWAARLAARAALRTSPNEVRLIGTSEALEPLEDLATDVSLTPRASKHLAKGFAKVWAGCDSLVFPAASASDMPAIRQATKNFEGAIILGTAPSFGPKAKQLGSNGGDVAVVCCPESLGVSLGTDADSVQSDRFGAVRAFSGMAEATVVLADSQPMVALPATALGVLGKSVESFHSRGVRAATCGVMGAVACWTETSIAALAGIHLMVQAMDAWAEKNKGRSAPLAMEVADSITWMAH
nr:MAG: hypothetical protein CSA75_02540 [Sorangium cellulosum]